MAVANYQSANGCYPPAFVQGPDGRPWHSWRVLLLPYLERTDLYNDYNFSEPWDGPNNRQLAGRMPSNYAFHGDDKPGQTTTNYLAVVGPHTAWPGATPRRLEEVTDGTASTILVVENRGANVPWLEPRDLAFDRMSLRLNNPDGIGSKYLDPAAAMLDGMVRRLGPNLTPETLRALLTADGGEDLRDDGGGTWTLLRDGRDRPPAEP